MYNPQPNPTPVTLGTDKRMILLAVLAPFGAIALLAVPLFFDAARSLAGF
jgi:hypothetical protein